jgi:eukaryotic-like serine/threonine-protein kinase
MSKLSVDKFLTLVERSKLVEAVPLAQFRAQWQRDAPLAEVNEAEPCAERMVAEGLLTSWQSRKLLEGRYRGFYLGRYKLLSHLGSGGMSNVYLAQHTLLSRLAAIKVLPHNRVAEATYLARFQQEARAIAALDHPNFVRAYDLDQDGKIHYLVMEYIAGRDLNTMVLEDGPLDFHAAANYVAQTAAGLEHAHRLQVVHRDIKPANLLVDGTGTVKILDLGLARHDLVEGLGVPADSEDHVLGTADYLAPEQAVNSNTVDARADVYALGCTLYFLLTGHPPFDTGTSTQRVRAHQLQTPPEIKIDRPDVPQALVAICRRMMEKRAIDRYQSACEAEAALAAWLESEGMGERVFLPSQYGGTSRSPESALSRVPDSQISLISGSSPNIPLPRPAAGEALPSSDVGDIWDADSIDQPPLPPAPPPIPQPAAAVPVATSEPSLPVASVVAPTLIGPPTRVSPISPGELPLGFGSGRATLARRSGGALWILLISGLIVFAGMLALLALPR